MMMDKLETGLHLPGFLEVWECSSTQWNIWLILFSIIYLPAWEWCVHYFLAYESSCSFTNFTRTSFPKQIISQLIFIWFLNDGSNCFDREFSATHSTIMMINYHLMKSWKEFLCHCENHHRSQLEFQWVSKVYISIVSFQSWCKVCSNCSMEMCKLIIWTEVNPKLHFSPVSFIFSVLSVSLNLCGDKHHLFNFSSYIVFTIFNLHFRLVVIMELIIFLKLASF